MAKTKANFDDDVTESELKTSELMKPSEFDQKLAVLSDWDALENELASEGLRRVQVDVSSYWEADLSPIYGELMGIAKAIQTEYGATGIYAIKLLRPCAVRLGSKQDADVDIAGPGSIVGVFHSVGLNPLKNMGGAKVAIRRLPKSQLSKGREMWNYDIIGDDVRNPLEIVDSRKPEDTGAPF